jgi:uncharacterized protein (DUF2267 family)
MQTLASYHYIKYQRLLTRLAKKLQSSNDVEKVDRILHHILHTLRANLPFKAAIRLLELLPPMLKPVFIKNWDIAQHEQTFVSPDHFIYQVRERAKPIAFYDFPTEVGVEKTITIVFGCLERGLPQEQKKQIKLIIPATLRELFYDHSSIQAIYFNQGIPYSQWAS